MSTSSFAFNPFATIQEVSEWYRIPDSSLDRGWHLMPGERGYINGLPHSHGTLIATDYMMCIVCNGSQHAIVGHLKWWTPLPVEGDDFFVPKDKPKATRVDKIGEWLKELFV